MAKQDKVGSEEAVKWIKKNVGFWLHYSDAEKKPYIAEIGTGKILRAATEADIAKWNKAWNKVMSKVFEHNKGQDS